MEPRMERRYKILNCSQDSRIYFLSFFKGVDENPKPQHNRVDLVLTNHNETMHPIEEFNFDLKINSTKLGIWLNFTKLGIGKKFQ